MERNYGLEIDQLRKELAEIRIMLEDLLPVCNSCSDPKEAVNHVQKMKNMHPDPSIMTIMDRLENHCGKSGDTGRMTYLGVFSSGGRQSNWIRNDVSADKLLKLIENHTAENVLACIGSSDRLNILLTILKKPMTVAQLVEECGYNSTGQVYHHLKPLLTADLVTEDKNAPKGTYVIQPHRVGGILMLLAGIQDMVDPEFTQGNWEE
ncbi:MAG: helix-turn-helix domain-containing protein [Candidatus Merdivicinus sp.]|jgi:hypothetical protein